MYSVQPDVGKGLLLTERNSPPTKKPDLDTMRKETELFFIEVFCLCQDIFVNAEIK